MLETATTISMSPPVPAELGGIAPSAPRRAQPFGPPVVEPEEEELVESGVSTTGNAASFQIVQPSQSDAAEAKNTSAPATRLTRRPSCRPRCGGARADDKSSD